MSEVKRFEMEKEYSLDINIVPTEYPDGSFVHYDDYAALQEQLAQRDAQITRLTTERDALREEKIGKNSNTRDAADIYFQLIEECEIPPGGSLVQYVDGLKEQMAALTADNRNYSELLQYHIDRQAKAEGQVAALTAENVALKELISDYAKHKTAFDDFDGDRRGIAEHLYEAEQALLSDHETPATDAAANALRADGVKQFANQQRRIAIEQEKFGDYEFSRHCSISADEADEFAVAIRERNDG